jgi:hypothetical protein
MAFDTEFRTKLPDGGFHGFSERIRVRVEMQRHRMGFPDELAEDLDRFSLTDDQARTEGFKIAGERPEAVAEELLPVRAGPGVGTFPLAENIKRDEGKDGFRRVAQSQIICNAQIAAKPMNY